MTSEPHPDTSNRTIRAVDLFCGASGLSWGLVEALEDVASTKVLEEEA